MSPKYIKSCPSIIFAYTCLHIGSIHFAKKKSKSVLCQVTRIKHLRGNLRKKPLKIWVRSLYWWRISARSSADSEDSGSKVKK